MAGEWRERPLAELTDNFDSIRAPVKEADRRAGPYPYYGASGIVDHVDSYLLDGEYLLIAGMARTSEREIHQSRFSRMEDFG
jgi:type I restriction enzyme S subunit